MELNRRNRGVRNVMNKSHTISYSEKKCKINFDINIFKMLCNYAVTSNKKVRRSCLIQLRNLIHSMDMSVFNSEPLKQAYINFMKKAIKARLDYGNITRELLIQGAIDGLTTESQFKIEDFEEMSNADVEYLNKLISDALIATYLDESAEELIQLGTALKSADYSNRADLDNKYEAFIAKEHARIRSARSITTQTASFDFRVDHFKDQLFDIHERLTASNRFLYTGMQGYNMLIGGAFEATRVYLMLGSAAVGKSMSMLNIALQIKKYNTYYEPKDPTKIPTIVYLTQENDVDETVSRMFAILCDGKKFSDYTKEQIYDMLINEGGCVLTDESNINIMVIYKPSDSIDTSDLYTIAEELEDDGYEMIMLLQDHVKRIRTVNHDHRADKRLELGDVINEFKVFAQIKQVSVLTVGHFNRSADVTVENASAKNVADIGKLLGRSHTGESLLMIDNADFVLSLHRGYDRQNNPYLEINQLKQRNGAPPEIKYIAQPFDPNNTARLLTDLNEEPVYKLTLGDELQKVVNNQSLRNKAVRTIYEDDDDDIFDSEEQDKIDEIQSQFNPANIFPNTPNIMFSSMGTTYDMGSIPDDIATTDEECDNGCEEIVKLMV